MASAAALVAAAAAAVHGITAPNDKNDPPDEPQSHHDVLAGQLVARARNHILLAAADHPTSGVASSSSSLDPVSVWSVLHQQLLTPQLPFAVHRLCYELVYAAQQQEDPNAIQPSWIPLSHHHSFYPTSTTSSTNAETTTTHVEQDMHELGLTSYHELYEWSIQHKNEFWMRAAEKVGIQWMQPPQRALEDEHDRFGIVNEATAQEETQYYPGARLNIAESCLRGNKDDNDDIAVVYANDADPSNLQYWTVQDLRTKSHRVAHSIQSVWQFPPGTAMALCMPMTPESLAVYLGVVLAGCVVVSIADSFSAHEIAQRCHAASARAIFTQDVIVRGNQALPLYERVVQAQDLILDLEAAARGEAVDEKECKSEDDATENPALFPMKVVVLPAALHTGPYGTKDNRNAPTPAGNCRISPSELHESIQLRPHLDWSWHEFLFGATNDNEEVALPAFDPVACHSMDACNILFSSGTTGSAKAIVWHHVTPIKCVVDGYYHQDVGPTDRVCWPTNMGWMMGPWLLYQRINGAAICLYQGLPHTPEFCKFVEKAGVTLLGVIPSLVKQWQARNSCRDADWSRIRRFSSTGEASDPVNYLWLQSRVPGYAPVIEYCGGTEIGGSFLSSTMAHANVPSMFATPCLGSELRLLEAATGRVLKESEYRPRGNSRGLDSSAATVVASGELVLLPPSIGWSTRLLHRSHFDCYYKGMPTLCNGQNLRRHGDEMQVVHGTGSATPYFRALGRVDDTMNLGGIKVSSVEIERVCNAVDVVKETAAIAISTGGPCQLIVYAVLVVAENEVKPKELQKAMQLSIKKGLNPLFGISDVVIKDTLPRTASNKIMRRLLRDEYLRNMIEY